MELDNYAGILHTQSCNYYIIKLIGEGATSFVYQCQTDDLSTFAIKLYTQEFAFINETSIISKIPPSKSIVKMFAYGEGTIERGGSLESFTITENFNTDTKINYAIFEYLPNGELFDFIHYPNRGFDEKIVRNLFIQILDAVELCHKNGIIHSDLKLENILLSSTYELKLIDFGYSREMNGNDSRQYKWLGTVHYAAPEVHFSPEKNGYDGIKNDVFSLGIMLFILVIGFYPFSKPILADPSYRLFMEEEYFLFWDKYEHFKCSENFKALFNRMVCFDPDNRIGIDEIKNHPWLNEIEENSIILDNEILEKEFSERKSIIDDKKEEIM